MATTKKSFIIYKDSVQIVPELDDEQAGKLFKAIVNYQLGIEQEVDKITGYLFVQFKNQFMRDDAKWLIISEKRIEAGAKGGKQKVANATNCKQNVAVTVTDTVTDTVTVTDKKRNKKISGIRKYFLLDVPKQKLKYSQIRNYYRFIEWIQSNAPDVLKLEETFTVKQYLKIRAKHPTDFITTLLMDMHNYKPLLKKYKSAYSTFIKWSKSREEAKPKEEKYVSPGATLAR